MSRLSVEFRRGRAAKALELHSMSGSGREKRHNRKVRDYWDKVDDKMLKRVHTRHRKSLFTPLDVDPEGGFCPGHVVEHRRITKGNFEDGIVFSMCDDWTSPTSAHRVLAMSWTGATIFNRYSPGATGQRKGSP